MISFEPAVHSLLPTVQPDKPAPASASKTVTQQPQDTFSLTAEAASALADAKKPPPEPLQVAIRGAADEGPVFSGGRAPMATWKAPGAEADEVGNTFFNAFAVETGAATNRSPIYDAVPSGSPGSAYAGYGPTAASTAPSRVLADA